jgi:single-strand DNA-binding protein
MASLNKVQIIGHLGKDPVSRQVGDSSVCNFSVAVSDKFKGRDGTQQDRTEWVNCVAWGKLGEICAQYLSKGTLVYCDGELRTSSWDKDGVKQYKTEVNVKEMQILSRKDGGQRQSEPPGADGDLPF